MPKSQILWGINVYTRLNHLRLQQALIRRHLGDKVELLTFSNHERNGADSLHYMEDHLHIHPVNSGAHTGCQDAYNEGLRYLRPEHEFIIWSHADCILDNYSFIEETLGEMRNEGAVFAVFEGVTRRNNPRSETFGNEMPYALNDLMVFRADFYRRIFPRHEVLDGFVDGVMSPYGVEVAVGKWVTESLREGEVIHAMGRKISHHQFADKLGACQASCCMSNNFDRTVQFVRSHLDESTIGWLEERGLLERKYDDVRQGWD